jgi:hypothetical protein
MESKSRNLLKPGMAFKQKPSVKEMGPGTLSDNHSSQSNKTLKMVVKVISGNKVDQTAVERQRLHQGRST